MLFAFAIELDDRNTINIIIITTTKTTTTKENIE